MLFLMRPAPSLLVEVAAPYWVGLGLGGKWNVVNGRRLVLSLETLL